jgi:hypothetical protein
MGGGVSRSAIADSCRWLSPALPTLAAPRYSSPESSSSWALPWTNVGDLFEVVFAAALVAFHDLPDFSQLTLEGFLDPLQIVDLPSDIGIVDSETQALPHVRHSRL